MNTIAVIAVCALYSFACLCFGAWLLRVLGFRGRGLLAAGSAFLLGSGVLACAIWQLLAVAGLFSTGVVLAVLAVITVLGLRDTLPMCRELILGIKPGLRWFWHLSLGWKAVVILIALMAVRTIAYSFLPPQALGDAAAFYLVLPKLIVSTGMLVPVPRYEAFVAYTLQGELHYAALMAISTFAAAKMFTVPVAIATAALLVVFARSVGIGWRGQLIAVAALCSSSAFIQYIGYGKTDPFSIAMCLAAVYWVTEIDGDQPNLALWLTGLFGGLAVTAKVSNVAFMPLMIFLLIVIPYVRKSDAPLLSRRALLPLLRSLVIVFVFAAVLLIPHLIKNAVVFRNPLAPFVASPGTGNLARVVIGLTSKNEESIRRVLLGFPLFLVYAFTGNIDHLSVLPLAFVPLIFALPRAFWTIGNRICLLLIAGFAGLAVWQVTETVQVFPRYYFIALVPVILLVSYAADYVLTDARFEPRLGLLIVTSAVVALSIIHTDFFLGLTADFLQQARGYEIGQIPECNFEDITSDRSCHASLILNQQADPGARILLAGFTSARFWLRTDLILCSSNRSEMTFTQNTHAERWRNVYENGFEYVFYNLANDPYQLGPPDIDEGLPDGLKAEPIYNDNAFTLYRLSSTNPALQPEKTCQPQSRPNLWSVVPVLSQS